MSTVLKLTLPGHYGIQASRRLRLRCRSEVDPTGSLWYIFLFIITTLFIVLKLTLPGHYGIPGKRSMYTLLEF